VINMKLLSAAIIMISMLISAFATPTFAVEIKGAGATFPLPLYAQWAESYKAETSQIISYNGIGSAGGIKFIKAAAVTFGGSDMPLPPNELEKSGLIQFPTVIGGDVPIINVPGIKTGELVLNGPILAKIFLGEIKKWNDPEISKLNTNIALPNLPIVVVHRSDGSGTSFVWTDYLSKVSADWKAKVGASTHVQWPEGIGGQGNDGVAKNVIDISGSIGYVEAAFAKKRHIPVARMINKSGKIVSPNMKSFEVAAQNIDWLKSKNFNISLTDQSGDEAWPIVSATFILMHKIPVDAAQTKAALMFFSWAYEKGDIIAKELDYVPMPDQVVAHIKKVWASEIIWPDGKPLNLQ
jgi:phosphate transport system substrate-binding protein